MIITENPFWITSTSLIDSWEKWPSIWISAWIHWNEHAWVNTLEHLYKEIIEWSIELISWKVYFILKWNEKALEENKRFIEHDLNRCVENYWENNKSIYEIKRWQEMKKIITESDVSHWLDLHTVSAPSAKPYLFSWIDWYKFAKNLWIQNIAINWWNASNTIDKPNNEFIQNFKNQWIADFVNSNWWLWYTFEAWSHEWFDWQINSYKAIINFLLSLKMIDDNYLSKNTINWWDYKNIKKHVHMEYKHIFKWWFEYKNNENPWSFTYFNEWDLIWYDIINWEKIEVKAVINWYIVLPKDPSICENWKEIFFFWQNINNI